MSLTVTSAARFAPRTVRSQAIPTPAVESKSLAARLRQTWATVQLHGAAVHRDARFAGPHRARMWEAAHALLEARPQGADAHKLKEPLAALKAFVAEFEPYADSGDELLQARIFSGYAKERPGLTRLLNDVLEASGMGRVHAFVDQVDA